MPKLIDAPKTKHFLLMPLVAGLIACGSDQAADGVEVQPSQPKPMVSPDKDMATTQAVPGAGETTALAEVLNAQPDEVKARYGARHPEETLTFFGVEQGMTVVETDPGGGWYSNILRPYLGDRGTLIGADYALDMYPLFEYYSEEELAAKATWHTRWPAQIAADGTGAAVSAYNLGSLPASLDGSVDVFLFVRSLHNLVDFEAEGGFATTAIAEAFRVLKPGGVVGVVQHMGPETHSDDWASGGNGYLKRSAVIALMESGGFTLDGASEVNLNPADQPTEEEYVWRLPPTSEDPEDAALAAQYQAIGESNRMTLRFVKPAED